MGSIAGPVKVSLGLRERWWVKPALRGIIWISKHLPDGIAVRVFDYSKSPMREFWTIFGRYGWKAEVR